METYLKVWTNGKKQSCLFGGGYPPWGHMDFSQEPPLPDYNEQMTNYVSMPYVNKTLVDHANAKIKLHLENTCVVTGNTLTYQLSPVRHVPNYQLDYRLYYVKEIQFIEIDGEFCRP